VSQRGGNESAPDTQTGRQRVAQIVVLCRSQRTEQWHTHPSDRLGSHSSQFRVRRTLDSVQVLSGRTAPVQIGPARVKGRGGNGIPPAPDPFGCDTLDHRAGERSPAGVLQPPCGHTVTLAATGGCCGVEKVPVGPRRVCFSVCFARACLSQVAVQPGRLCHTLPSPARRIPCADNAAEDAAGPAGGARLYARGVAARALARVGGRGSAEPMQRRAARSGARSTERLISRVPPAPKLPLVFIKPKSKYRGRDASASRAARRPIVASRSGIGRGWFPATHLLAACDFDKRTLERARSRETATNRTDVAAWGKKRFHNSFSLQQVVANTDPDYPQRPIRSVGQTARRVQPTFSAICTALGPQGPQGHPIAVALPASRSLPARSRSRAVTRAGSAKAASCRRTPRPRWLDGHGLEPRVRGFGIAGRRPAGRLGHGGELPRRSRRRWLSLRPTASGTRTCTVSWWASSPTDMAEAIP